MSPFRCGVLACLVLSATCVLAADDLHLQSPRVVTANANDGSIRLVGSPTACQLRVQILSPAGSLLADSEWRDGNLLDWPMTGLASGSYRCVLGVTDIDGTVTTSEVQVIVSGDEVALDHDVSPARKVTLVLHDETSGSIVSTAGDLTFKFGDALSGHDAERMRITTDGKVGIGTDKPQAPLDVNGLIRAGGGIEFADGTILRSASAAGPSSPAATPRPSAPSPAAGITGGATVATTAPRQSPPKTAVGPAPQFVVDDTGVHVGTTPAYGLNAGNLVTQSNLALPNTSSAASGVLTIGGNPYLHGFGAENIFVGNSAGNFTLIGADNTAVGYASLLVDSTGFSNTAVGANTLLSNTSGKRNTATGAYALQFVVSGFDNTAVGDHALAQSTGDENTAVGSRAIALALNSFDNTAVGTDAMGAASGSPAFNTATGESALNHVSAIQNSAFGALAMQATTVGADNVAAGYQAMKLNTSGGSNTAIGSGALSALTTGSSNIAIGANAGSSLTTQSGNIDIGSGGVAGDSQVMRLGGSITKTFISGIRGVTTGATGAIAVLIDANGQLGTTSSSRRFKFDIQDAGDSTSNLMRLRPVTFRYISHGPDAPLQYGLIAEEVAKVYPEMVARDKDGQPETVMYQFLAPMLLNELQKEHRKNEEQAQTIDELRDEMQTLARRLQALEAERANR